MATDLLNKKIEYWEHQLLDFGKRNKMINYRETKRTTLRITEPSFGELFQRLALKEETLTFKRAVDRETDVRVYSIISLLENLSVSFPVMIGDINTEGSVPERQITLKNLRSKARLALEEQGINILYLSFGFMEWKDIKGSNAQWVKSPLILVPVVLSLESLNAPYTLKKHEDDIVLNPTLEYYLKTEYGIDLPKFDPEKDTLDSYLDSLEEIADCRGWRIFRETNLGLLSFLKISMYYDLLRNKERIKENPVIRAMAGDCDEANALPEHLNNFDLDSISTQDCYQVMSADSSQQDAILYSKNGISFVMEGPPGAGKSQTITNIIAEAIAEGKKVLFVSEKMAALQVVYRRLQEVHLGDFCLPLHSYKANKKETLEQIGATLKLKQARVKDSAINNLEELLSIRQELNKYAQELHELNPQLNISCYEVYSKLEQVNDAPALIFVFDDPLGVSQAKLQEYLNSLKEYALALERLGYQVENNPWEGYISRESGYEYTEQLKGELAEFTRCLDELMKVIEGVTELSGLNGTLSYECVPAAADLLEKMCRLPQIPEAWLGEFDFEEGILTATKAKGMYTKLSESEKEISEVFSDEIHKYGYNEWKDRMSAEADSLVSMPLLKGKTADYFVKENTYLKTHFSKLKSALSDICGTFAVINGILGTEFTVNACNCQKTESMFELMRSNRILNKQWFSDGVDSIRNLVVQARTVSDEIASAKEKLLADWESEILTLDYAPMLMRYKSDYTGVLKVFNGQYKEDRRQIQVLSKTVIKKPSDEVVIDLLSTLKRYHDNMSWLEENSLMLSEALAGYYKGMDSNWDAALNAIDTAVKLKELYGSDITERFIDLVSSEHSKQTAEVGSLITELNNSFVTARKEISATGADIDTGTASFSVTDAIQTIEAYLSKLDRISSTREELNPYITDTEMSVEKIYYAIGKLNEYRERLHLLDSLSEDYKAMFGYLFSYGETDWDNVIDLLYRVAEIKGADFFHSLSPIINVSAERKEEVIEAVGKIRDSYDEGTDGFGWIEKQFSEETAPDTMRLTVLYEKLSACLNDISGAEKWIDYVEAKEVCADTGLEDFIVKIENGYIREDIEKVFLKGFYRMWLEAVREKSATVRRFRRNVQDDRIKKFIELDDLQLRIAQMRIREKLIDNLPSTHRMLRATDEVAILNKELGKKRNIMPLRKLFRKIPNLLMTLKPCLMMSPLSVSYFLETQAYHFDLVIFDEASQIFPEDAIGAIFRGSQVIIVGDSKQLPPTNFFASTTSNSDADFDVEEEEDIDEVVSDSILEEAAAVLPNRTLLWHYRSKHESLIAFSNREIYMNNLITFPSSINNAPDMGVEYVYVQDGVYDRGKKKNNIREAEECVRLVSEHIEKHPDRSLGIIAFSESQQNTIENAIIGYRKANPSNEWFFDETREEPFFVKNLENVQGDERDTIIFSICYGKDAKGVMHMNFGPVGHNGGERRLNVAVTRAKCNVKLVGSILPTDINIDRAKAEGVRMLRAYIEYAIKGESALRPVEKAEELGNEDGFCEIIAKFLEDNGYEIKRKVGCSDYKIDIAVVNPMAEGEFIAGVECDGLSYVHAKTARDRDHLRKSVLEKMGWNMYRVWSTQWQRNPQAEGEALLEFLKQLCDEKRDTVRKSEDNGGEEDETPAEITESEPEEPVGRETDGNPYGFELYCEGKWWEADHSAGIDDLTVISENILHIVRVEQPIHIELLYKRMYSSFSVERVTEGVKNAVNQAIEEVLRDRVTVDEDRFVRLLPLTPVTVRIPSEEDAPRPIEYIHREELAAAMEKIVSVSFGITQEDLASECAGVFGFERKGPKIKAGTDDAIRFLLNENKIRIIDGKVQLTGE